MNPNGLLPKLLAFLEENSLSKEDFVKSFSNVVDLIKKLRSDFEAQSQELQDGIKKLSDTLSKKTDKAEADAARSLDSKFATLKAEVASQFSFLSDAVNSKLAEVQDGTPGAPGKDADEVQIKRQLSKELKSYLDSLFKDAEKALEDAVGKIPDRPVRTVFGPLPRKPTLVDLSGSLDGSTKTFNVGFKHFGVIGVWSSSTPFAWRPTIDYTESGQNIVFDASIDASVMLAAGQTLVVQVLK